MNRALDFSLPGSLVLPPSHSSTKADVREGRLPGLDHVREGTGDWIFPTWLPERAPCAVSLVSAQARRQRCSSPWPLSPSEYEVVKRGSALALPLASPLPCMTGSPWRLPASYNCLHALSQPCVCLSSLSRVQLFVTLWTAACEAPLSMRFSWQEHWSGLPFSSSSRGSP